MSTYIKNNFRRNIIKRKIYRKKKRQRRKDIKGSTFIKSHEATSYCLGWRQ